MQDKEIGIIRKIDKEIGKELKQLKNINDLSSISRAYVIDENSDIIGLSIYSFRLQNFSILYEFKKLKYLYLNGCQITDISFLNSLTNLISVDLWANPISDISPIKNLTKLQKINFQQNKIKNIEILSHLTELVEINLEMNQIEDISSISELKCLTKLSLSQNKISNIKPIENLSTLEMLNLSGNLIKNINALKNLQNIIYLNLTSNNITNIDILKNITKLNILHLSSNLIKDISQLAHLTDLTGLGLSSNQIENIDSVKTLKKINYLRLSNNKISDFSAIRNLKNITDLSLSKNQISNLSPFKNLKNLKRLDMSSNNIKELPDWFSEFIKLESLNITNNKLTSLFQGINKLTNLYELRCSKNNIKSLPNELRDLDKLSSIWLGNNKIKDISILGQCKRLSFIEISNNKVTDISTLEQLGKLSTLNLKNNPIKVFPEWIIKTKMNIVWEHYNSSIVSGSVYFYSNPIENLPLPILKQGREAIIDFFEHHLIDNKEVKIIFLGNSTVGKTSIIDYLTEYRYPPQKTTHGIEVTNWSLENELNVLIWDFGGQEYYHSTHRLFFTDNTIYCVVWEKQTNKPGVISTSVKVNETTTETKNLRHFNYEYWFKLIRKHFNNDSKIIAIQNKTDISKKEVINQNIIDKYDIYDQYHISIKKALQLDSDYEYDYEYFEKKIKLFIKTQSFSKFPDGSKAGKIQRYINTIRESIKTWGVDYLTIKEFKQKAIFIAKEGGDEIQEKEIRIALTYLHNSGYLLFYGNNQNSILKNYVFINPNYVTNTIYKILDNDVQKYGGKFDYNHILKLVKNEEEATFFIELMQYPNFELIFKYNSYFYATQFLPDTNDLIDFEKDELIFAFSLRFPSFYSHTYIVRFITRYGFYADKSYFYRNGIVLKQMGIKYLIFADNDKETITVKTTKEGKSHEFIRKIYDIFVEYALGDKNVMVSIDGENFASLEEIERLRLRGHRIESLSIPIQDRKEEQLKNIFPYQNSKELFLSLIKNLKTMKDAPSIYIKNKSEPELNKHLGDFLNSSNRKLRFEPEYVGGLSGTKNSSGHIDIAVSKGKDKITLIEALKQTSPKYLIKHLEKSADNYNQLKHNFVIILTYNNKMEFLNEWEKYMKWYSELVNKEAKYNQLEVIDNELLDGDSQIFKFAYSDYQIDNGRKTRIYHLFVDFAE